MAEIRRFGMARLGSGSGIVLALVAGFRRLTSSRKENRRHSIGQLIIEHFFTITSLPTLVEFLLKHD